MSVLLFFYFAVLAFAESGPGIGGVAQNILEPVVIISNFVSSTAIIIGVSCIFGAFIRYLQHRTNPLAHPISIVVVLLIMGIVLICLPLAYRLSGTGVPFGFHFHQ